MFYLPSEGKIGCAYRVSSKYVELPESSACSPDCGLLFDRQAMAQLAPETMPLLSNRFVATVLPNDRAICLFSEQCWSGVCDKLEGLSEENRDSRRIQRLMFGFQSSLEATCPLIISDALKSYAELSGDDVLVVYGQDYMERWSERNMVPYLKTE